MGYLYDHDDVESLGFGINFHDYDGLDYEDRRDQISSALVYQGLSIGDAFNSDDNDFLSARCSGYYPYIKSDESANAVENYVSCQTFPVVIGKRGEFIEATMTYVVDNETSKITVTRVCFRPSPSFPRQSQPSFDSESNSFRCSALRTYSTMERAIRGVEVFAIDNKHNLENLIWKPVSNITLGKRGSRCRYSIKTLCGGSYDRNSWYGLMISNGHEYYDITPFVRKFTHAGLIKVTKLLSNPIFMSAVVEYYYNGREGLTPASLVSTLFAASYYYDSKKAVERFSEKYKSRATSHMKIYESTKTREGCQLRLYTEDDCRIVACEIRCGGRVIYCNDDLSTPYKRMGFCGSEFAYIFDDDVVVRCIIGRRLLSCIMLDNWSVDFGNVSD